MSIIETDEVIKKFTCPMCLSTTRIKERAERCLKECKELGFNKLPRSAMLLDSLMTLNKVVPEGDFWGNFESKPPYLEYRCKDGGWRVSIKRKNDKIYSVSTMPHLNNIEMIGEI
jgi:hypothetical protein